MFISLFYLLWWSRIFGVPTVLVLGSHSPHPYTTVNLTDECLVCSDFSTHLVFFPLPGSLYSSRHNNIEIRPVHNPMVASTRSSERQSCMPLTWDKKQGPISLARNLKVLVAQSCLTLCNPMDCGPLSMEFSRQEYWSELPFPSPGHLPNPGIEPGSPTLQADSLPSEPQGKPQA